MAAPKGFQPPIRGSRKGIPNKISAALKAMILGAHDDVGGREYLAKQALEEPVAFLALLGKVLPTTLSGDDGQPLVVNIVRFGDLGTAEPIDEGGQ